MTDVLRFVTANPDAAMITLGRDGTPHAARVELGVVRGRIQSTGAPNLVRTANIRRDPRCTLFAFGEAPRWLGISTVAHILDGHDAVERSIALLTSRHRGAAPPGFVLAHDDEIGGDRIYSLEEYRDYAGSRGLFVFDFDVRACYGNA